MILNTLHYMSPALGMNTTVNVLLPQGNYGANFGFNGSQFRTLYLLHGLSDDETIWLRRTSIERYAEKYGICVVMPRGDRSFYCDIPYGSAYFRYISEELPEVIANTFNVSRRREDNFAAGLSMGGYGALKLGLRLPERFALAAAMSAVTDLQSRAKDVLGGFYPEGYIVPPEDDLTALARQTADKIEKPEFFIGCGTEDVLLPDSRNFRDTLVSLGYTVNYRESAGIHSWEFWDEYIQYVLEWIDAYKM